MNNKKKKNEIITNNIIKEAVANKIETKKKGIKLNIKDNLFPKQRELIASFHKYFFTVVVGSRQSGKTYSEIDFTIKEALNNSNMPIIIVSPTEPQTKRIYREYAKLLLPHDQLIRKKEASKGTFRFEFNNGSEITFLNLSSRENIRGRNCANGWLILDEAAFMDFELVSTILFPMLINQSYGCIISSTANGENWFHKWYLKGFDKKKHPNINSIKLHYTNNPYSDLAFIEMQKEILPPHVFLQEYECEFLANGGKIFLNVEESATAQLSNVIDHSQSYYVGIDVGLVNDKTVLTILNSNFEVKYIHVIHNTTTPELIAEIEKVITDYKPKKVVIETTGIGRPVYDFLMLKFKRILIPFNSSNTSKEKLINELSSAFSSGAIKIPKNKNLIDELNAYSISRTKLNKVVYAGKNHADDHVMSLALAYHCAMESGARGGNKFMMMVG